MDMYVLWNPKTHRYIAIDHASGGYPSDVTLEHATRFTGFDEAESYNAVMSWKDYDNPLYEIHQLIMSAYAVPSAKGAELKSRRK